MKILEGLKAHIDPNLVCKVLKSLHDFKHSSRDLWYYQTRDPYEFNSSLVCKTINANT